MREWDIWADREPGSCGGAPEKRPLRPFVRFSPQKEEKSGGFSSRDHAIFFASLHDRGENQRCVANISIFRQK